MKISGLKDTALEITMEESQESIALTSVDEKARAALQVILDEHALNLLIKNLQSKAEDMRRHREITEAEKLSSEGRLH